MIKDEKYWEEEHKKCRASVVYFYNNYVRKPGELMYTDEDFEALKRGFSNFPMLKYRNRLAYLKTFENEPKRQ